MKIPVKNLKAAARAVACFLTPVSETHQEHLTELLVQLARCAQIENSRDGDGAKLIDERLQAAERVAASFEVMLLHFYKPDGSGFTGPDLLVMAETALREYRAKFPKVS